MKEPGHQPPNSEASEDATSASEAFSAGLLEQRQQALFGQLLPQLADNGFYGPKLRASGFDPRKLRSGLSLSCLRELPFTHKRELVEDQLLHPPYGSLPAQPLSRHRYVHQTSGTSGKPLYWLDDEQSWRGWMRCWQEVYRGAGVGEQDVVFCAFSFGPFVAHWTALEAARQVGALALAGGGLSSLERLERLLLHRASVVVSTPTYALHLARMARETGLELPSSCVMKTIHAGEPGASLPEVRDLLEASWGARCFDHVGATEVGAWGFPCLSNRRGVHLNEKEFVFEVVDSKSGQPVADGERGELVVTTLSRSCMPVLRYRTGDMVVRSPRPCPCGNVCSWIEGGVIGRADDMLNVRGVNVYPSAVDRLVRRYPEIVEYEVEVRRVGALDELSVRIEVEAGTDGPQAALQLEKLLRSNLELRVPVTPVGDQQLPRYEAKASRFKRL